MTLGTLLVCFTDKKDRRSVMYSLGDSALFRAQHGECSLVLSPVRYAGALCCLTTTKGAYKAARVKIESVLPSDAVFLCTDGIYTLMKDYSVEKERPITPLRTEERE